MVNFIPTIRLAQSILKRHFPSVDKLLRILASQKISPSKRAFEKYKPQGLFSEFYGMLFKLLFWKNIQAFSFKLSPNPFHNKIIYLNVRINLGPFPNPFQENDILLHNEAYLLQVKIVLHDCKKLKSFTNLTYYKILESHWLLVAVICDNRT